MMTLEERRDPDHFPGFATAVPLGFQHVLAMFVGNITPAIIVAGAGGFGFGSDDPVILIYMLQVSMLFAGVATLLQTVGMGPVGARLPIVADSGLAGMAAISAGALLSGLLHAVFSLFIGRIRFLLPPLVTGLVVAMIGLSLLKVGVQYAAGGVPLKGSEAYGAGLGWALAVLVIIATVVIRFFGKGLLSVSSVLIGLLIGYIAALALGRIDFAAVETAGWTALPQPFYFGFELSTAALVGFFFMSIVSTIETVGDTSAITEYGAKRPATDKELSGATLADGLGTSVAAVFGGLPNTSFSQNAGLIAMTGIMSRHIVTIGAFILIICGFIPKIGAVLTTIPIEVLGGSVIIMFGLIVSAAMGILSKVEWTDKSMMVFGLSLSLGVGMLLEPTALQHAPKIVQLLLSSGILPAAALAILLNLILPEQDTDTA